MRRYLCSTRRHGEGCDQPIAKAEPLEEQLVGWLRDFQPDQALRRRILDAIRSQDRKDDDTARRAELGGQIDRLKDLSRNPMKPDRDSSVPRAGATGLEPATSGVTGAAKERRSAF